jgi:Rod binding domain-containing protein
MEISATIPISRAIQPNPANQPAGKATPPDASAKLKESCRQFEAILWRSVLEKSRSSQSGSEEGEGLESGDKTGTYQYFVNDTIANSVSGLPSSFSSVLFASLSPHLAQKPPLPDPS